MMLTAAVSCSDPSVTTSSPSPRYQSWSPGNDSENTASTSGRMFGCPTSLPILTIGWRTLKLIEMFARCMEICQRVSVGLHSHPKRVAPMGEVKVLRNTDSLADKKQYAWPWVSWEFGCVSSNDASLLSTRMPWFPGVYF